MKIVALSIDLMDQSRLRSVDADIVFVRRPEDLAPKVVELSADLAVIDLTRPGALDAIADLDVATLGFGPHVDADLLAAATAAGCETVVPRSKLLRRLGDLVAGD